jgi:hypothetical protein
VALGFKQGVCLAALSTKLASVAPAYAATAYEAPATCPSEPELRDAIGARLIDDTVVVPEFRLVIAASQAPGQFVGELEMDGELRRSLVAPTCADVVEGAAVIIALRVAEREAEARRAREQALPQAAPPPSQPAVLRAPPLSPAAPPVAAAARPQAAKGLSYAFSAGGGVWGGAAPELLWGPAIAVALRTHGKWPWSVRLGAERGASGTVQTQPAAIWTRLTTGSLSACAFVLGRALHVATVARRPARGPVGAGLGWSPFGHAHRSGF